VVIYVVSYFIGRKRMWTSLAHSGSSVAHLLLVAARLRALRRLAIGMIAMLTALELNQYLIAFTSALVAYHGVLDHVFASRAARVLADLPSAQVVAPRV
jgi:hypothetical protein